MGPPGFGRFASIRLASIVPEVAYPVPTIRSLGMLTSLTMGTLAKTFMLRQMGEWSVTGELELLERFQALF
jgi:hypothetical protein